MIYGVFERKNGQGVNPGLLQDAVTSTYSAIKQCKIYTDDCIGFSYFDPFETTGYKALNPVSQDGKNLAVVFSGKIYNYNELINDLCTEDIPHDNKNAAYLVLELYKQYGIEFVKKINGKFAFAIWDKTRHHLILVRDRMGIEPLYYYVDDKRLVFSSSIHSILKYPEINKELNLSAIGKFLLFNYNLGLQSFFNGITKLRPAHYLTVESNNIKTNRYWSLSFSGILQGSESEISEELLGNLRDAVDIRLDSHDSPGVFLSGGMDSSTVLALLNEKINKPLQTFSYRCKSDSFDESYYARLMAKSADSTHSETEYTIQDVLLMPEIVKWMDEPFCDIGINIATYILGKEANQKVSCVFTGDGGDELFGGHPVYEADKIADYIDCIPDVLKNPFIRLCSFLPDADKKKNMIVKIKRFSESLCHNKELLTHRWRIYYSEDELRKLVNSDISSMMKELDFFEDIFLYNTEADGKDLLSRALYSDYQTVMDFYLRRNDLNRMFNLETRYPLLDHRLVEYCARIPSSLKIKGWFDTKYIFKKSMEKVLPHEIVFRKDKLGHSIPLKNWLRDEKQVREFLMDYVSGNTIRKRGIFNPDYVSCLISDHMSKKRNNSHRLWGLAVLEMWLREHYDQN